MGIRIQPREIEVPEDDPFRNDLLGRRESVEVLTHLVSSLEGPCVLAVDAAWGNGKSTFLRIWAQHLRNQEFPVVEFNAWENDFSGDPFVTLSTELTAGLHEYDDKSLSKKIANTKKQAKEIVRGAVPDLIRLGAASISLVGAEVGQVLASYAEGRLSEYQKMQESVKKFRDALQAMADAVSKASANRPLIVIIDELDRCRPSYAVELLEVAKHLFAVDHIVFVLAVNRAELAHSIKALYGDGFDAQGYLRRFFDVDFVLPEPDRKAFIDQMLVSIKIDDYFARTKDQTARRDYEAVKKWLQCFFHAPDLSLRRIAQAIHRLGLVLASLRSDQRSFALTAVVCLILRTVDLDLYRRFVGREASDLDVVDKVFNRSWAGTMEQKKERYLFEAMIIVFAQDDGTLARLELKDPINSPLLQRYEALVIREASGNASREHAEAVIRLVEQLRREISWEKGGAGFKHSVHRIELLSPGLIDEPAK